MHRWSNSSEFIISNKNKLFLCFKGPPEVWVQWLGRIPCFECCIPGP